MIQTFEDLIDLFATVDSRGKPVSGPAEIQRFLKLKGTNHGYELQRRGYIPPNYWPGLIKEAKRRGFSDVTLELLARLAIERKCRDAHAPRETEAA